MPLSHPALARLPRGRCVRCACGSSVRYTAPAPGWPERIALTVGILLFVGRGLGRGGPGAGARVQEGRPPVPPADLGNALAGPLRAATWPRRPATASSSSSGPGPRRGRPAGRHRRRCLPRAHGCAWGVPARAALRGARLEHAARRYGPRLPAASSSSPGRTGGGPSTPPSAPTAPRRHAEVVDAVERLLARQARPAPTDSQGPRRSPHDQPSDPRARGRPHLPRRGLRRRRRDLRRGGLLHRHDRLPGDADRPVVPPPGRGA